MKSSVTGRRRGDDEEKCCKYYQVEAELAARRWEQFCWDQHYEKGFVQRYFREMFLKH